VLTGYDTTPRGELLVSTFTAAMHPRYPMAGHVLPVIFSWHLKMQINAVAKDAARALDPDEFWRAWAAGAATTVDTFAPGWDFWEHTGTPLGALRTGWLIPAEGLDGPHARAARRSTTGSGRRRRRPARRRAAPRYRTTSSPPQRPAPAARRQ
jgi:hypothetical protein